MRYLGLSIAVLAVVLGPVLLGGCGQKPAGEPFLIVWSYDTSGYLEPCGCSAHQLGGLARRASKIAELRTGQPVFAIEGARHLEEGGEFRLFKSEILIKSLNSMGYDALMLGAREAAQGRSGIENLIAVARFPLFSANLEVEGVSWPERVVIKEIAGSRLAVTGASQPEIVEYDLPEGVRFGDPMAALASVLGTVGDGADLVVVCLEGKTDWIERVIDRFRDRVDLFLTGDLRDIDIMSRSQITARLDFRDDPPVLNNLAWGRYLGVVTATPRRGGYRFSGTNVPLDEAIAEDAAVLDIMAKDFRPQLVNYFTQFTGQLPQAYKSPKTCADCHPDEYDVYATTGHSRAMETLERVGQVYNPDCMGCHLTYDPEQDQLRAMHCVSCHGNIVWDHAFKAEADMVEMPDPPVTAYRYEWCVRCHDAVNSLPFEEHWPQYVQQIYHGGDLTAARAAAERMGLDMDQPPPDFASGRAE